ncbi:hypothetical protein KPH14_005953 [Odynerus spinipes]|nr:hypothetical protein KPH14_005953 [Odynerus spinipes]
MAAHRGRYYAGPGNHFYKLLYESGLTPKYISFEEDYKLPQYGIGLTNIVSRPTKSSADLSKAEIKEGAKIVEEKIKYYKPKIAIFNGKCIYEIYANKNNKSTFHFGLQPECIGDSAVWVVPSSSARCANFPRMADKLHFYTALKKYLQFLKGEIKEVDLKEFLFEGKCKQFIPRTSKMWRRKNMSAFVRGGRVANKDTIYLDTSDENIAIVCSTEFIVKRLEQEKHNDEKVCSSQENLELSHANNEISNKDVEERLQENNEHKDSQSDQNNETEVILPTTKSVNEKSKRKCHRKHRQIKKLSPKSIKVQRSIKTDDSLDFVKLIKQRLLEKKDNAEDVKNDN